MTENIFYKYAQIVFDRTRFNNANEEINKLASNMKLLYENRLQKLNETLISNSHKSTRNIWDFLAEHNFATQLVLFEGEKEIEYEPDRFKRPPDFVVSNSKRTFYIQMKNLSESERENRRNKVIEEIKRNLIRFKESKFLSLKLHEDFNEKDIEDLLHHIDCKLASGEMLKHKITRDGVVIAEFNLHTPNITFLEHMKVGTVSDLNMINITGEDREQIYKSLCKADGAFLNETNNENINIVVMEADNHSDIDIAEALFGEELFHCHQDGNRSWCRDPGGYFCDEDKQNLVSGIVAIRRIDQSPVSIYENTLFINSKHEQHIDMISEIIKIDNLIRYCDLPTR